MHAYSTPIGCLGEFYGVERIYSKPKLSIAWLLDGSFEVDVKIDALTSDKNKIDNCLFIIQNQIRGTAERHNLLLSLIKNLYKSKITFLTVFFFLTYVCFFGIHHWDLGIVNLYVGFVGYSGQKAKNESRRQKGLRTCTGTKQKKKIWIQA